MLRRNGCVLLCMLHILANASVICTNNLMINIRWRQEIVIMMEGEADIDGGVIVYHQLEI